MKEQRLHRERERERGERGERLKIGENIERVIEEREKRERE